MDWFPLLNSLRVATVATAAAFVLGVAAANCAARLPRPAEGVLDILLTLPLVLPPSAAGYLLLCLLGPRGAFAALGAEPAAQWLSAVFAAGVAALPFAYRAARSAFRRFDETYADAGRTLGLPNAWIFWHIRLPRCRRGLLAGAVLSFARSLGEFGATVMLVGSASGAATVATEVYRLWLGGDDAAALRWVLVSAALSAGALLAVWLLESREGKR